MFVMAGGQVGAAHSFLKWSGMRWIPVFVALVGSLAISCAAEQAKALADPFSEIGAIEKTADHKNPSDVRHLMESARRLTLHGTARGYARELLAIAPNDEAARAFLHYKKFVDANSEPVWLDWFDAGMWQSFGTVRDPNLGYCLVSDRKAVQDGRIRSRDLGLVSIQDLDNRHSSWSTAHEVDSRFFHIRSTIPLAAVWYVADDLDRLALAYLDLFEIERLPPKRFTVHLYGTQADAVAAQADAPLLKTYGAYYSPPQQILHVEFDSLGGLTAVRHEVAHALNREFADPNPPQWFDEGIGVLCQFAVPTEDGRFEFGQFPADHGFGTKFIEETRSGFRQRMATIHSTAHVVTDSHYYSMFRSMVDFFMVAENRKYRMVFIDTMFRHRRDPSQLVTLPGIDDEWVRYVRALQPDDGWHWKPYPTERAELMQRVIAAGTSSVIFASAKHGAN
jgi:hypothetical protein